MSKRTHLFGDYILKRRVEIGLKQSDIAKSLGVAQNFVSYLENGKRKPTNDMIKKLSKILALPTDQLYLKSHPDLMELISYDEIEGRIRQQISPLLEELKNDKSLRNQHAITDEEIDQLASLKLRGEVKRKMDYVFLLMSIRQVIS